MGLGDELMVTGRARAMQLQDPRKVRVMDHRHGQRWSDVWENNPRIVEGEVEPGDDYQVLIDCPGNRPYIREKHPDRWFWREHKPEPGELYFSIHEKLFAEKFDPGVIIEPNVKIKASPNKQWGTKRWLEFVERCNRLGIKLSMFGKTEMPGVNLINTLTFRQACAVMAQAKAYVGHEGGLHHGAAAVGVPAIVIFGGFISPEVTGYETHSNFFSADEEHPLGCGMRTPCLHCKAAMKSIEAEHVVNELERIL